MMQQPLGYFSTLRGKPLYVIRSPEDYATLFPSSVSLEYVGLRKSTNNSMAKFAAAIFTLERMN